MLHAALGLDPASSIPPNGLWRNGTPAILLLSMYGRVGCHARDWEWQAALPATRLADEFTRSYSVAQYSLFPAPKYRERGALFSAPRTAKKTAVLLDGGFVRRRFTQLTGRRIAAHDVLTLAGGLLDSVEEEIFRVYFYDCAPSAVTTTHPISRRPLNLDTTFAHRENSSFQSALTQIDQMALRKGELAFRGWSLTRGATADLIQNGPRALTNDDVEMNFTQKGVDMRIGLDVAWLSIKHVVERIVLCTGDRDFVPGE